MKLVSTKHQIEHDKFVAFGMLTVSFVGVMTLAQRETLSEPLRYASYCFAIAIPLLTLGAYIVLLDSLSAYTVDPPIIGHAVVIGALATVCGFAAVFWHFSVLHAQIFLGLSLAGVIGAMVFDSQYEKVQPDEGKKTID